MQQFAMYEKICTTYEIWDSAPTEKLLKGYSIRHTSTSPLQVMPIVIAEQADENLHVRTSFSRNMYVLDFAP